MSATSRPGPEYILAAMDVADRLVEAHPELAAGRVVAVVSRAKRKVDAGLRGGVGLSPALYAAELEAVARADLLRPQPHRLRPRVTALHA